ncbi:putative transposase [Candidatus Jidaibacter acanthamoeba]|uniref:Putative transposase n=1 Tax=Candidatus Jidaibacter acanthamoebae TaxID=86105 RepID=A0A0C1MS13_9RICK|nr:Rpn family recombination-promoting nuclease/putative transposase [Candidatus Jidaibacter acanthamoeba]KIE04872.1 putative transposase [Candidatus Jidaibacter acanthamoeba]
MPFVKYLDPKNDIAFKKIFGSEKNKDIVVHFLNDILGKTGEGKIKEVSFLNPVQIPEIAVKKQSIIDVLCTDESGVQYIVEMQVAKVRGFEKRAQYYAAKAYSNQMNSGEEYGSLKEVIFLAIVDFVMFPDKEGYKSEHVILDKASYENDLKDFSFTFIELPKFKKDRVEDLKTHEEKWCYFFKHSKNPENIEKLIKSSDNVISKAYDALLSHHWSDQELNAYEQVTKANLDALAREAQVKEEAMAEGMEKGIIEGEKNKTLEIAKKMLFKNIPVEEIIELTGLTVKEIKEIK